MVGLDGGMASGKRACRRVVFCWLLFSSHPFWREPLSPGNARPTAKSTGAKEEKLGMRGGVQLGLPLPSLYK